jgi:MoxR-like ATPase
VHIRLKCTAQDGSALKDLPRDAVQPPLEPQPVVGLVLIDQSLGPHVLLEGPPSADSWAA